LPNFTSIYNDTIAKIRAAIAIEQKERAPDNDKESEEDEPNTWSAPIKQNKSNCYKCTITMIITLILSNNHHDCLSFTI
jgi:hypothetical protein